MPITPSADPYEVKSFGSRNGSVSHYYIGGHGPIRVGPSGVWVCLDSSCYGRDCHRISVAKTWAAFHEKDER